MWVFCKLATAPRQFHTSNKRYLMDFPAVEELVILLKGLDFDLLFHLTGGSRQEVVVGPFKKS